MDLDLSFIGAVLRTEKGFYTSKRASVSAHMLQGEVAIHGWDFIENHVLEFGSVPSPEFFSAKTGIQLIDTSDDLSVLIKDLKERALWIELRAGHERAGEFLEKRKSQDALDVFQKTVSKAYKDRVAGGRVDSLMSLGPDVLEYYNRMKSGERGILSPWDAMNQSTLGWWGGDFIVFVARMGTGKTFSMLMLARQAWLSGKRVLFVGTEMNRIKLAIRFYAIHLKLSYQELRVGELGEFNEKRLIDGVNDLMSQDGLYIVGDDFDASMDEIEAAVDEVDPHLVLVDGLYLVKNEGRDRHTRVSNNADDLKRMAKRRDLPIIASSQFNREVDTNSKAKVSSENIGITDVIGWNADVIYGMYQTDDMREDRIMGFRPMKLREGTGNDFFTKWRFDDMDFEQDEDQNSSASGDYEYKGVDIRDPDDGWGDDDGGGTLF